MVRTTIKDKYRTYLSGGDQALYTTFVLDISSPTAERIPIK